MLSETITRNGRVYRVQVEPDDCYRTPWDNECGHGPVSDWTSRSKLPGELVLCENRSSFRYYDFAEACRIARREGWGFLPGGLKTEKITEKAFRAYVPATCSGPKLSAIGSDKNRAIRNLYAAHRVTTSARQYAAGAALADYDSLRRWCNGDWHYVGVIVTAECECCGSSSGESASVWRIESDADECLEETALELIEEIESRIGDAA